MNRADVGTGISPPKPGLSPSTGHTLMSAASRQRNERVERAVHRALSRIDAFIAGEPIDLPNGEYRGAVERLLAEQKASIRTAVLFLMFYRLEDPAWDLSSVPSGS